MSVSIGLARFLAGAVVDKVASVDANTAVSMGLDWSGGRKVGRSEIDIVLKRLGELLVCWFLNQDLSAVRQHLIETFAEL